MLDFLKGCHRQAPFLLFNGNTFADIGRQVAAVIFAELPEIRRREVISAIAHYVAGVLDRESMAEIVDALWRDAQLAPGDRVRTLRGSLRGEVVEILDDGRVKWRAETGSLLVGSPGSLVPDE